MLGLANAPPGLRALDIGDRLSPNTDVRLAKWAETRPGSNVEGAARYPVMRPDARVRPRRHARRSRLLLARRRQKRSATPTLSSSSRSDRSVRRRRHRRKHGPRPHWWLAAGRRLGSEPQPYRRRPLPWASGRKGADRRRWKKAWSRSNLLPQRPVHGLQLIASSGRSADDQDRHLARWLWASWCARPTTW